MGNFVCLFGNKTDLLGAIFDKSKKLNSAILEYAVEKANRIILNESGIELKCANGIRIIEYGNEFDAAESVCDLLTVNKLRSKLIFHLK